MGELDEDYLGELDEVLLDGHAVGDHVVREQVAPLP